MHPVRILRSQNVLPPALELRSRRAAALRGDLQRPAEMFSRVLQTDTQTVVTVDLIVERADMAELLGQVRHSLYLAGLELAPDLPRQPRLPLRTPPDHDGIGT